MIAKYPILIFTRLSLQLPLLSANNCRLLLLLPCSWYWCFDIKVVASSCIYHLCPVRDVFCVMSQVHSESPNCMDFHRHEPSGNTVPHTTIAGGSGMHVGAHAAGRDKPKEGTATGVAGGSGGIMSAESSRLSMNLRDNNMLVQLKQALSLDLEERGGPGANGPNSMSNANVGLNRPPLPTSNRNSLRIAAPVDGFEVEIPHSVMSQKGADSAPYTPLMDSSRNSLRLDMTVLDPVSNRITTSGAAISPRSSIVTSGSSIVCQVKQPHPISTQFKP